MQKLGLLTLTLIMGLVAISTATANIAEPSQPNSAIKEATITKMYEQDVINQGMDDPVVLQQYGSQELQAAMKLERDYFDREQMSCHIGYDVLWDSQDPNYEQDKQFSVTEQGLVKVSLAQGSDVYYELSCDNSNYQVTDVILDDQGNSLKDYLKEACG
ncbi:hypothetical protein H4W00_001776 [Psychrobacter sp. PL19]|uniref:hypothetical protein n=1 Tax=Psychrobacter sp. PL19 TaxID=2760711 RepID=UPI001AE55860